MFTPGTIKAIGLMSKGVSADKAFSEGNQVDNQAAAVRTNFYGSNMYSNSTSGVYQSMGTTVAPGLPKPTAPIIPNQSLEQMIKSGTYKRNIPGPPSLDAGGNVIPAAQKKLTAFYDQKFSLTPEEESAITAKNAFEPLQVYGGELTKNTWGIVDKNSQINAASEQVAKLLNKQFKESDAMIMSEQYAAYNKNIFKELSDRGIVSKEAYSELESEQALAEQRATATGRYANLKSAATKFLTSDADVEEIKASKKVLDAQIEKGFAELNKQFKPVSGNIGPVLSGSSAGTVSGVDATLNAAKRAELTQLKNSLNKTYENKILNIIGDQRTTNLVNGISQSTDTEEFLKRPTTTDLADPKALGAIIRQAYPHDYLNRPLTPQDIKLGGEKVLNEQALLRFEENTNLTLAEAIAESRYDNTRNHIVEAYQKLGTYVDNSLNRKAIEVVRKQEALIATSKKENLTPEEYKKVEADFKSSGKELELYQKLIKKTSQDYSYDAIKKDKAVKNFAGSYLAEQEALLGESKIYYSGELNALEKGLAVASKGSAYFLSAVAKLGFQAVESVSIKRGWDGLATASRRIGNYVSPRELINFDIQNNKGEFQTGKDFYFVDDEGNQNYQPSALLYTGAEIAPLVIATVYGGSAITSLGGRALSSSLSSLTAKGLMSAQRANQFNRVLATTGNYGQALRGTVSQSSKGIVRALADRIPSAMSMGALVYPQQFAATYNELYQKGIKDARGKAHTIAALTTGIEILTENIFPDIKYLDDFELKGFGKNKWTGSYQQYRTLYGDVFDKTFSGKTLDYLASRSLMNLGKVGAGARFMIKRGIEEGIEEVSAELMNHYADNHMGLAAMKGEAPKELETEDIVNAFAGAFLGPPIGLGTQVSNYEKNRKTGQLFDIMMNAQYYKNKINTELKAGKLSAQQASVAIAKIQELETVEQQNGIKNLRNFQNNKEIETLDDLMSDPTMQFDYFEKVLKKQDIDKKLADAGTALYTDAQREDLIKQGEEASRTINDYKERADFYGQMTVADKKVVLDKNIDNKVNLSRGLDSQNLDKMSAEIEQLTAEARVNNRPEYFVESLRRYRDNLAQIKTDRVVAQERAFEDGTYNPIVDQLENKVPESSIGGFETAEELEDSLVQAMISPDRGKELYMFLSGDLDRHLENLDKDSEAIIENFLENLNATTKTASTLEAEKNGEEETDPIKRYSSLKDLSPEQFEDLSEMLSVINNEHDDLTERKEKINTILNEAILNTVAKGNVSIAQQESLMENVAIKFQAVSRLLQGDQAFEQGVFYDKFRFIEFLAANADKINDYIAQVKANQTPAETREEVTIEEGGTSFTLPELLPEDISVDFEESISQLEESPIDFVGSSVLGTFADQQEYSTARTKLINGLLLDVSNSPTLDSAKAKMAAVMQAAGESIQDIQETLELMNTVGKGMPIMEEDGTHMFNMLDIVGDFTSKFIGKTDNVIGENLGVITPTEVVAEQSADAIADIERKRQEELFDILSEEDKQIASKIPEGDKRNKWVKTRVSKTTKGTDAIEKHNAEDALNISSDVATRIAAKRKLESNQPFNEGSISDINKVIFKIKNNEILIGGEKLIKDYYDAELAALGQPVAEVIEFTPPVIEAPVPLPVTEEQKSELEQKSSISSTSPLFFETKGNGAYFQTQEKIIKLITQEPTKTKPVLVDMFTVIEEVLGAEVLREMEDIFNEIQSTPTLSEQRTLELYEQFKKLIPTSFMKASVRDYIFNTQMIDKVSVADVSQVDQIKENATIEELIAINKNRKVSVQMADGRKFGEAIVQTKDGKLLLLIKNGTDVVAADGTVTTKDLWLQADPSKDKIVGLVYPKIGATPISFSALNTLVFSTINESGKIQKFNTDGNKDNNGKSSLFLYLPTSKYKPNPTPVEQQFDSMRKQLVVGGRVKHEVSLVSIPYAQEIKTIEDPNNAELTIQQNSGYVIEFNNSDIMPTMSYPTATAQKEAVKVKEQIAAPKVKTQASTVAALEKLIEESKAVGDPSKEGYVINGNRYERQSRFVQRVLGEKKVNTEDSTRNMEMGAAVGNFVDILGRDILGGKPVKSLKEYLAEAREMNKPLRGKQGYELAISPEQFNALVAEMQSVAKELTDKGWKVFTEGLIVHREFTQEEKDATGYFGVAGAMDIIAVDTEGNTHIIDFKNKKFNTLEKFTSSMYLMNARFPSAVSKWSIQQSTYAILSEDFDLSPASINILAFASEYEESSVPDTFNQTLVPQIPGVQNNPKTVGTNVEVIVVQDAQDKPSIFNPWINKKIDGSSSSAFLVNAETQKLFELGQKLDNENAPWTIGSFRAEVSGRRIVDVFAGGEHFLVYKSTGTGTGAESEGEWTPITGFATNGWFIKSMWNGKNPKFSKYDSKTFLAMHNYLNENEGTLFVKPGVITIKGLTLASNKAPITDKHKSPISDKIISLSYDFQVIKQIKARTNTPQEQVAVQPAPTEVAPVATTAPSVDISKEVILSGLREGFQGVSYSSFDIRNDVNVMNQIQSNKSFSTTVERKGKKYVLVGLRIIQDVVAKTSGRDGYSFAMIEDNGSLPSNIVDLLKEQAISNISNIYRDIAAVESSVKPMESATTIGINTITENIPELGGVNSQSTLNTLSSLGFDINSELGRTGLGDGDKTPDNINPKIC